MNGFHNRFSIIKIDAVASITIRVVTHSSTSLHRVDIKSHGSDKFHFQSSSAQYESFGLMNEKIKIPPCSY